MEDKVCVRWLATLLWCRFTVAHFVNLCFKVVVGIRELKYIYLDFFRIGEYLLTSTDICCLDFVSVAYKFTQKRHRAKYQLASKVERAC